MSTAATFWSRHTLWGALCLRTRRWDGGGIQGEGVHENSGLMLNGG